MLGRGILQKTVFGNCFLISLQKDRSDTVEVLPIPNVEQVVEFLKTPSKERTKETIVEMGRFFAEKEFFKKYISQGNPEVVDQCGKGKVIII